MAGRGMAVLERCHLLLSLNQGISSTSTSTVNLAKTIVSFDLNGLYQSNSIQEMLEGKRFEALATV